MQNNTKRRLANYLAGRQSPVTYNGKTFPTESPKALFFPLHFSNLYMHDTSATPANTKIMSYADDFTITSTHNDIPTATTQLQNYLQNITDMV